MKVTASDTGIEQSWGQSLVIGVLGALGYLGAMVTATKLFFMGKPKTLKNEQLFTKKAPKQITPPGKETTTTHTRYNPKTQQLEKSVVKYDKHGRQISRTDYTDHGYPDNHTSPHHHTTEYGSGHGAGWEKGPFNGPYGNDPFSIH